MNLDPKELLTVTFTLFAVIDIIGSVPILISLKEKMGGIRELRATIISGALMILFLFVGKGFLNLLGLDVKSFAVATGQIILQPINSTEDPTGELVNLILKPTQESEINFSKIRYFIYRGLKKGDFLNSADNVLTSKS